jgi:hypothetical protein
MIIRIYETTDTSLVKERTFAPTDPGVEFGTMNLLMFSSTELRQGFGLKIADTDARNLAELVQSLANCEGQPTDVRIEEARLTRLLEARPHLLPCFIGYQETPTGKLVPLMMDGPEGKWSLFFASNGAMTLVEYQGGAWRVLTGAELLPDVRTRSPISETKSFLLNGLRTARSKLVRSDERRQ